MPSAATGADTEWATDPAVPVNHEGAPVGIQSRVTAAATPGMLGSAAVPRSTGPSAIDIVLVGVPDAPAVNPATESATGAVTFVAIVGLELPRR